MNGAVNLSSFFFFFKLNKLQLRIAALRLSGAPLPLTLLCFSAEAAGANLKGHRSKPVHLGNIYGSFSSFEKRL